MTKKLRVFWKQMKSEQHSFGAITLCLILIIASVTAMFIIIPESVRAANPYSSWHNYKNVSIYVSAGNTCPVGFQTFLNVTYDTGMQADFDDLRFLHTDEETELDFWLESKSDNNWAWVWVATLEEIDDTNQTICYMYYNNSGASSTSNMSATWNWSEDWRETNHFSNYTADSVSTSTGYKIHIASGLTSYRVIQQRKVNFWDTGASANSYQWMINHGDFVKDTGNSTNFKVSPNTGNGADGTHSATDVDIRADDVTYNGKGWVACTMLENVSFKFMVNGSNAEDDVYSRVFSNDWTTSYWIDNSDAWPSNTTIYIGHSYVNDGNLHGHIAYVPSAGGLQIWANDTGNSASGYVVEWQALGLHAVDPFPTVWFGPEEEEAGGEPSVYSLKGLTNNRVTWSGTAGSVVWTNTSGDYHEWLEINMSINSSENVTDILVFMGDLNDTNAWINASNISLYCTTVDNGTYYSFGSYTDGGSNISLNQSQWETYAPALENPFNGSGLTNCNYSIYCVFRLEIPSGLSTDTFQTVTAIANKVYLGHYV